MTQRHAESYNGFEIVVEVVATDDCRVRISGSFFRPSSIS